MKVVKFLYFIRNPKSATYKGNIWDRHKMHTNSFQLTDLAGSCRMTLQACLAVLPPHTTIQQLFRVAIYVSDTLAGAGYKVSRRIMSPALPADANLCAHQGSPMNAQ